MEVILGCFYSQNRLSKIPGYGQPKPCQTCKIFESYTPETNPIYHNFIGCPLATFMIQICDLYSVAIFGHRVNIDLNGIILLEFSKKHMVNTLKSQIRTIYTLPNQFYTHYIISTPEESLNHAYARSFALT